MVCRVAADAEVTDVIAAVPFTGNIRQVSFFPRQQTTATVVSKKIEPPEWQGAGCGPQAGTETFPYPAQGWCPYRCKSPVICLLAN